MITKKYSITSTCITFLLFLLSLSYTARGCLPCPLFTQPSYSASVPENTTIGTVVLTVLAFNSFGDPINYGTSYLGLNLPFEIDSATGDLRLASTLNYNVKNSYEIIVQANVYGYSKSVTATIDIIDSPDPPQPISCSPSELIVTVYENILPSYNTTTWLNCSRPSGEPFLYSLQNSLLSIDPLGFIITEREFDYENQSIYDISVTFNELDNSQASGYANITLMILPINEYTPHFISNSSDVVFILPESISIGSFIGQLIANDEDYGLDGLLRFELDHPGGNGSKYVTITPAGLLYTTHHFDYEESNVFELFVIVSDSPWNNSSSPLTNTTTVLLVISDVNDNSPSFTQTIYYAQIPENRLGHVMTVECTDDDSPSNAIPVYSIVHDSNYFTINSTTGNIYIQSHNELDYENLTTHQFTVLCVDNTQPTFSSQAIVVIDVLSVNEYNCSFNQTQYIFSITEDTSIGTLIGHVYATDSDVGLAGELSYELLINDTQCSKMIQIGENSGEIRLLSNLDYEQLQHITCTIRVTDKQEPLTQDLTDITLHIINMNDNPPNCSPIESPIEVYRNVSLGTPLVSIYCSDSDGDNMTFTNTGNQFKIEQNDYSTSLVLNQSLATCTSFQIDVHVTDGNYYTRLPVWFSVISPPSFAFPVYNCTVYEDTLIGAVVCQIESPYSTRLIINNSQDNDTFVILPTSGEIILSKVLNYEITSNYTLTIQDEGNPSVSTTVNILVQDINDNSPSIQEYIVTNVKENTLLNDIVTHIECSDKDSEENGQVVLNVTSIQSISQNGTSISVPYDGNPFSIDPLTGLLTVNDVIDYETCHSYQLIIECFDQGSPSLTSTSTILINVQEENEYLPIFTNPSQPLSLTLSSLTDQVGSILYTFKAQDLDSGFSGQIQYSLIDSQLLRVDSKTGDLILVLPPSCIHSRDYLLVARDRGNPPLATNVSFYVTITDCYTEPIANPKIYYASIAENTPNGTIVTTVNCTSMDDIYYNMSDEYFQVDSNTGIVTTTLVGLDYELETCHRCIVHCYSYPSLYTELFLHISIEPVNDNTPFFTTASNQSIISIPEDTLPGTVITSLTAHDKDKGIDGEINYFLLNSTEIFAIDKLTGDIYLTSYLDREETPFYSLTIMAVDTPLVSNDHKSTYIELLVQVTDVNDNTPQCSENVYRISLTQNTLIGAFITQIYCHDIDSGENSRVVYSMTHSLFHINATTGQVYLSSQLIPLQQSLFHTIPILVHDSAATVDSLYTTVYLAVEIVLEGESVERGETNSEISQEGSQNSIAIVIDNLNINQVSYNSICRNEFDYYL